ncbi:MULTISPECIES: hypothetical protein [Pseudoalteromonas]|uniref:Peptidylprolyl isomerase n=1 Tax=Pseudoalteromonas haloplanktis TaxID=228 RepID=A0ABU1BGP1_PSEHA|nr:MULTISPECIES: hypothetical protein [Pseudoalteromonas]MCF6144276.1 hypothetical protein [Pseudoalteromonas mariniglutinosa NCIMB 1770]MDQ9093649.1 hypothetical protein [Pseudoalteromonas haloplanktis]BDF95520.1 hypothetical protein KAN5_23580 [Pseudoalteromonas sp. KAN5]
MKNLIKKTLPVFLIAATFGTSSAMAAGNPELVMQQLGSLHISKSVVQQAQAKEQAFENGLDTKLDVNLEKSMDELQKQIDKKLADKLDKA